MGGSLRYHQASNQHTRQCQQRSAQAPIGRAPFRMTQCPGSLPTSQRSLGYRLYRTCLVDIQSVHLFSVVKILPQDSHPYSHHHRDIVIRVDGFLKKEASQRCIPHTQNHRTQLSQPYPYTLETQNQTLHLILQKASQSPHSTLGKINQSLHPIHPAGTSVGSVGYDKPVHSASHCGQWVTFFWQVVRQILWKIRGYHSHL